MNTPKVELSPIKRRVINKLWHVYGNNGEKSTSPNHKFIQNLLELGIDYRKFHKPSNECKMVIDDVLEADVLENASCKNGQVEIEVAGEVIKILVLPKYKNVDIVYKVKPFRVIACLVVGTGILIKSSKQKGRPKLQAGETGKYPESRKPATGPNIGRPKIMIDPVYFRFSLERELKTAFRELYGIKSAEKLRDLIAAHLATEAEAKQPIQGHLLRESDGWVRRDSGSNTLYEFEFYNKYGETQRVVVNENEDRQRLGVYIRTRSASNDEIIRFPKIKTMADLNQLLGWLKGD